MMFLKSFVLASFALASTARAQTAASAYVEPDVPTGKPIAGDYTGALRPQIHYSPPKDFMVSRTISMFSLRGLENISPSHKTNYATPIDCGMEYCCVNRELMD